MTTHPRVGTIGLGKRPLINPLRESNPQTSKHLSITALLRVLLNFTHSSDHVLEETASHVLAGMFGTATATFPSPPVTKAALQTAATDFTNAIAAQKEGGPAATAAKQVAAGAVRNCRLFEAQSQVAGGERVSAGMFQNSHEIIVTGLTPGTMYTFQLRAMGGSTGASDWSNPVSHMSL